jgi:hypothetical protein
MNRSAWCILGGLVAFVLTGCQALAGPLASSESKEVKPVAASGDKARAAAMNAPVIERRETIVATGYAVISVQNHKVPAQQRLLAIRASKLDAYRALAEQVFGQYLDATTTVADMTVMNDSFRARVEGIIYGAKLVSITPLGEDTYETTLSLDAAAVQALRALYPTQVHLR